MWGWWGLCLVCAGAPLAWVHLGTAPAQAHPPSFPGTGLLQLLLHLPLPEPHLQAATGHRQRHRVGVLPEALEAGGWILGPAVPTRASPALWAAAVPGTDLSKQGPGGTASWAVWPSGLGGCQGKGRQPLGHPTPGRRPRVTSSGGTSLRWAGRGGVAWLLTSRAPRWRRARQGRTAGCATTVPRACIYSRCCLRAMGSARRLGLASSSTSR